MSNLKALKWSQKNLNPLAELELTAYSALHEYVITEPKQGKFEIKKTRLGEPDKKSEYTTGFASVADAKEWAWAHYRDKMQPYVVPSPTWISVDDRLPEDDQSYICRLEDGGFVRYLVVMFFSQLNRFAIQNENVTHWMPIPEFSKQGE